MTSRLYHYVERAALQSRSGLHSKNVEKFTGEPQSVADRAGGERCATVYPHYKFMVAGGNKVDQTTK